MEAVLPLLKLVYPCDLRIILHRRTDVKIHFDVL